MRHKTRKATQTVPKPSVPTSFEAEVLPGLEPFARAELAALSGAELGVEAEGAVPFSLRGDPKRLQNLRTVVAVYAVLPFDVPRPKALLGHQHLSNLLKLMTDVRALGSAPGFSSFRFGAAGKGSAVFSRLAEVVERETSLRHDPEAGDLLLRIRRAGAGWEVLARLTPKPLSARPWRVCNLVGGLNATLAAAMLELARVKPRERVLNAMCGSGTLAIEQGLRLEPERLVACDLSDEALACARANLAAAGLTGTVELLRMDATRLELPDSSFEVVVADPPWGDAVGSHGTNATLYPAFLAEAARVTVPGGRLIVLTHELKLFERSLRAQSAWRPQGSFRAFHGGHYPQAHLLKRTY